MTFVMSTCKFKNLHWNHFAQWDAHEFIFNEDVLRNNMNIIHIFTLASLLNGKSGLKGFKYVFHDLGQIIRGIFKTTFFHNNFQMR